MEMSEWNKVTDINLNGCVIGMMYVFSEMQKAGGGSIMAGTSPYTAAKGALRVLSKSAAVDGGRRRDSVLSSAHPAPLFR
ncbi:SDR family NAD(P)-dependent oxidoreductase [Brevibacillus centrosporus]|uniref:SDR family NAD(P)-dependent oxidoreductase n=1 Tax=Brevibacillus centrosporus TaxID=54910 RepID=UPI00398722D5